VSAGGLRWVKLSERPVEEGDKVSVGEMHLAKGRRHAPSP